VKTALSLKVAAQPDDVTCGPTCLHAIYSYLGDSIALSQVLEETRMIPGGGTLEVFLANHALARGYRARLHSYNLHLFDPTWFGRPVAQIMERLRAQAAVKDDERLHLATTGYLEFLERGGHLLFEDLTPALIRRYLNRASPILAGLSATYLYRSVRERPSDCKDDDVAGEPLGHFVVLAGYDRERRQVRVADPYHANPLAPGGEYSVDIRRLVGAVFLGVATYDGSLLVIENAKGPAGG
jgi:hypothetical protein